jgi:hypothetical protein
MKTLGEDGINLLDLVRQRPDALRDGALSELTHDVDDKTIQNRPDHRSITARLGNASMRLNLGNAPNESVGLQHYERAASLRQ